MATIVTAAELAAYLRVAETTEGLDEALETAEALVAAHIGAPPASGLAEAAQDLTLYPERATRFLDLEVGPLTAIASIAVGPDTLELATVRPTAWYVQAKDPALTFTVGQAVAIAYTTGWTAETLPAQVRRAVLMTAAACFNRPDGTVSRTGFSEDVTFFRADRIPVDVPPLLANWRRLRV